MVQILRSVWIWGASAFLMLLWTAVVGSVWLFDRDRLKRRTARAFRRLGPVLAGVNPWRLHISGAEHLDPNQVYVVVSNHQSLADIPLIAHLRLDAKWLGKAELFKLPAMGWMMHMAGDVPVDRADRRHAARALLQCAQYLRQRCSVVFFPEGTRSRDGELLAFNEGPFQLAIREQVPVLPLVLDGSGNALPRNTWVFGASQDIYLRVLKAIPVDAWTVKQSGALRDVVRGEMAAELERMRGEKSSNP